MKREEKAEKVETFTSYTIQEVTHRDLLFSLSLSTFNLLFFPLFTTISEIPSLVFSYCTIPAYINPFSCCEIVYVKSL